MRYSKIKLGVDVMPVTFVVKVFDGTKLLSGYRQQADMNDEEVFCLFEIDRFLSSSFWTQIENLSNYYELSQFEVC